MPFGPTLLTCAWCGHRGPDVMLAYRKPMCGPHGSGVWPDWSCRSLVYQLEEPHRAELLRRAPGLARRLAAFPPQVGR